jgi:hypothetical protein
MFWQFIREAFSLKTVYKEIGAQNVQVRKPISDVYVKFYNCSLLLGETHFACDIFNIAKIQFIVFP